MPLRLPSVSLQSFALWRLHYCGPFCGLLRYRLHKIARASTKLGLRRYTTGSDLPMFSNARSPPDTPVSDNRSGRSGTLVPPEPLALRVAAASLAALTCCLDIPELAPCIPVPHAWHGYSRGQVFPFPDNEYSQLLAALPPPPACSVRTSESPYIQF